MIKVSIIGATGYSGQELLRLLSAHNKVEVKYLSSKSYVGQKYSDIYKNSSYNIECTEQDIEKFAKESDVVFLALPHGIASKEVTKNVLDKTKVIDIGADFRLKSKEVYEKWYSVEHHSANLLSDAIYGLSELNREEIKSAKLLANPGCYATCSILSLAPLVKAGFKNIVIDAKSGVSGAGRSLSMHSLYCECNENIKAYKVAAHRHTPEIEQALSALEPSDSSARETNRIGKPERAAEEAGRWGETVIRVTFVPHLIPMNRGILATCYVECDKTQKELEELYLDFYKKEHFVRIDTSGNSAETKWVRGSNFCDISVFKDERTNRAIITGAIDNLVKGAAGQAVQNMNIMFELNERTGLEYTPIFP